MPDSLFDQLKRGMETNDLTGVAELIARHRPAFAMASSDDGCHIMPVFAAMRSVEMADLLLSQGLDTAKISKWWAPGFGLNGVLPEIAERLIERGVTVTAHAAAALGLKVKLRKLLEEQPELVHAKGGDGGTPLQFSRDVETARLLVGRGAQLDPRDEDHDSTPAQWRIGDAPEVTRFLLERGARPDIFMAAALNDAGLAEKLVRDNPGCTGYRIGNNKGPFPGIGFQGRGGTIYQWTLGFNQSPQEIAFGRGHMEMFHFLMEHTSPLPRLLVACMLADREMALKITEEHPGLVDKLDAEDKALLAKSCWETNLNREAVRLMLDLGFPIDVPEFNHGFQALHNAAWCGDAELVKLLIGRGHPVDRRDPTYHSTPLGFAIYSCVTAQRHPEGDFPGVVRLLLEAGTPLDKSMYPSGNEGIDAVMRGRV